MSSFFGSYRSENHDVLLEFLMLLLRIRLPRHFLSIERIKLPGILQCEIADHAAHPGDALFSGDQRAGAAHVGFDPTGMEQDGDDFLGTQVD